MRLGPLFHAPDPHPDHHVGRVWPSTRVVEVLHACRRHGKAPVRVFLGRGVRIDELTDEVWTHHRLTKRTPRK